MATDDDGLKRTPLRIIRCAVIVVVAALAGGLIGIAATSDEEPPPLLDPRAAIWLTLGERRGDGLQFGRFLEDLVKASCPATNSRLFRYGTYPDESADRWRVRLVVIGATEGPCEIPTPGYIAVVDLQSLKVMPPEGSGVLESALSSFRSALP